MGVVLQMSDFRKPGKALQAEAATPEPEPAYYCIRCDADIFHLRPTGQVTCTNCGAAIRNIVVVESTPSPKEGREP